MADAEQPTKLQVANARPEDSGRGIAHLPRAIMASLGITDGDVIEISGKKVTPARAVGSTIGVAAFCGNLGSIGMIQFQAWALAHGLGYTPALVICGMSYLLALGFIQLLIPRIVAVEHDSGAPVIVAH